MGTEILIVVGILIAGRVLGLKPTYTLLAIFVVFLGIEIAHDAAGAAKVTKDVADHLATFLTNL